MHADRLTPPASAQARRLADELGVDLSTVHGSGPGGRIGRSDVERAALGHAVPVATPAAVPEATAAPPPAVPVPSPPPTPRPTFTLARRLEVEVDPGDAQDLARLVADATALALDDAGATVASVDDGIIEVRDGSLVVGLVVDAGARGFDTVQGAVAGEAWVLAVGTPGDRVVTHDGAPRAALVVPLTLTSPGGRPADAALLQRVAHLLAPPHPAEA